MKNLIKAKPYIFPVIGIICILWAEYVVRVLPYLLGSAMVIDGLLIGISCFQDKCFLNHDSEELVYGIVMFIMGVAFIIQGVNSLGPIGTTWAIIGIRKASKSLNQAIQQIYMKKQFVASFIAFLVRITLALLLLFDSLEKLSTHVVILGLELVATSVRFKE
ncbi:MAG: DUF308 domain-containing protein [Lachnospiraceae bacterium]